MSTLKFAIITDFIVLHHPALLHRHESYLYAGKSDRHSYQQLQNNIESNPL